MTLYDLDPLAATRLELLKIAGGDIVAAERMVAFLNAPAVEDAVAAAANPFKPMDSAPKDGRQLLLSDGEAVWIGEWRASKTVDLVTCGEEVSQGWHSLMARYSSKDLVPLAWADLPPPKAFGGCPADAALRDGEDA